MRRRPPWTRELREAREARHAAHLAQRMASLERHERRRWNGPPPFMIAVAMALVQILGTRAAAYGSTGTEVLDRTAYLLLLAGPLALVVRERWPLVSLVGALVPTAAYFSLGYPDGPGFLAAIVAMFTALAAGYRWLTWATVAAAFTVFAVLVRGEASVSRVVLIGVWCLVIAGFGEAARVRGVRYSQMARDWSTQQQLARAEEEKARAEQDRRQASDERLLIARELHDVIGHHLSLINVQAGVGLHLMDEQPEQARIALSAIKHASAEALRETRSVLAGLNPGEAAPRTPAPGLRDLDRLVAEARAVGLPVTVDTTGAPRPLPPQVDRAAFRIVQEALTNVRRHAGPGAAATIVVGYAPGELTIDVTDDGQATATTAPATTSGTAPSTSGTGAATSGTTPATSGTGVAKSGPGPAISGVGATRSGTAPSTSGTGAATSGTAPAARGPATTFSKAPAMLGMGAATSGLDPATAGTGAAMPGRGPATQEPATTSGTTPATWGTGAAMSGPGPAISGTGADSSGTTGSGDVTAVADGRSTAAIASAHVDAAAAGARSGAAGSGPGTVPSEPDTRSGASNASGATGAGPTGDLGASGVAGRAGSMGSVGAGGSVGREVGVSVGDAGNGSGSAGDGAGGSV
ncbi:histidine kinase, partial [Dactylosporangium siamense]